MRIVGAALYSNAELMVSTRNIKKIYDRQTEKHKELSVSTVVTVQFQTPKFTLVHNADRPIPTPQETNAVNSTPRATAR